MLARCFGVLLLVVVMAASAEPQSPAPLAAALPAPADWKALVCTALVALYVALRRSRWRAE